MKVLVSRSELAKFRRRCVRSYPKERIEILWGRQPAPGEFHVFLFGQIKHVGTRQSVRYGTTRAECELLAEETEELADATGLIPLGTIHSHPDCVDAIPSETDFDGAAADGEHVFGIAVVTHDKITNRKSVRVRMWAPSVVELVETSV